MASKCSRIFNKSSVFSLKSGISRCTTTSSSSSSLSSKSKSATTSFTTRPSLASAINAPLRRLSISRLPVELASMLPLHSVVANARMTSCLSSSSSCRALSQA